MSYVKVTINTKDGREFEVDVDTTNSAIRDEVMTIAKDGIFIEYQPAAWGPTTTIYVPPGNITDVIFRA